MRKDIVEQLRKDLSLPFKGTEQDWDIEMANSDRLKEFIEFYKHNDLSNPRKEAIVSLILASYDDFLNKNDLEIDETWKEIKSILTSEKLLLADILDYWSLSNQSYESDVFRITHLVREVLAVHTEEPEIDSWVHPTIGAP